MTNKELHKIMVDAVALLDKAHDEYAARSSKHAEALWDLIVSLENLSYPNDELGSKIGS